MLSGLDLSDIAAALITVAFSIVSAVVRREVKSLDSKIIAMESAQFQLYGKVHSFEVDMAVSKSQYADISTKLAAIEHQVAEVRDAISALRVELAGSGRRQ